MMKPSVLYYYSSVVLVLFLSRLSIRTAAAAFAPSSSSTVPRSLLPQKQQQTTVSISTRVQELMPHNHHLRSTARSSKKKDTRVLHAVQDLDVVGLVAGQENYGLAVVCLGEAFWSFLQAPGVDHGLKTLGPAVLASIVLVAVSGPMITSGEASNVGTGLWIATAVSTGLGASYVARLLAPFSPSPKEIAFGGLLVAIAGFFSFSQNLIVDGFVQLPSLPSLPSLPEIGF